MEAAAKRLVDALDGSMGHIAVVAANARTARELLLCIEPTLAERHCVWLRGAELDADATAMPLAPERPIAESLHATVRRLLAAARDEGRRLVVVVTEADGASADALERLRLTIECTSDAPELVRLVLLGGPALSARLARREARALASRVTTRLSVPPVPRNTPPREARAVITGTGGSPASRPPGDEPAPAPAERGPSTPLASAYRPAPRVSRLLTAALLGAIAYAGSLVFARSVWRAPSGEPAARNAVAMAAIELPATAARPPVRMAPATAQLAPRATEPVAAVVEAAAVIAKPVHAVAPSVAPVVEPVTPRPATPTVASARRPMPGPRRAARFSRPVAALQVGAFRRPENAAALLAELVRQFTDVSLSEVERDGVVLHRVRIAGLATAADADRAAAALERLGHRPIPVWN